MKRNSLPGIIPEAARQKLLLARKRHQPFYLFGATGFGKTTIIKEYLQHRNYFYVSGNELEQITSFDEYVKKENSVVVIDDLYLVRSTDNQSKILALCEQTDLWVILINRAPVPGWLLSCSVNCGMIVGTEEDLKLQVPDIQKMLKHYDISLSDEECRALMELSEGNGYALHSAALRLQDGSALTPEILQELSDSFSKRLEVTIVQSMSLDILEFLLQVSVVDEFNLELAEYITGNSKSAALIQKVQETGYFLFEKEGTYYLRAQLLDTLRNYVRKTYGSSYINEYYYNAGLYYETHDDLLNALRMYEIAGNHHRMRNILIRSARQNPSTGHYLELQKYYQALTEEEVSDSPVLMSALSMFYSMILQPEESEFWYKKLEEYSKVAVGIMRKEAIMRLAYLDIGLPHRGTKDLINIFKHFSQLMLTGDFTLPELSVTSNLPSTMNGGKDFCEWSKRDVEIATLLGKPISILLGKYGKGLVNEALGESIYEKGKDDFAVFSYLNKAHLEANIAGKMELLFAIVGVQVRMSATHGDISLAYEQLNSFRKKITQKDNSGLWQNLQAFYCRLDLYLNQSDAIQEWLTTSPDENESFFAMERYRYLIKIRCYIRDAEYAKALSLAERLLYYAEQYQRHYVVMETKLLWAVINYRMGHSWKEMFLDMLEQAYGYRFIRIISQEGNAVLPLLQEVKNVYGKEDSQKKEWFRKMIAEAEKVAKYYPAYLHSNMVSINNFSENAIQILKLQAEGMTVKQISQKLNLSEATVKYHTTETYRKLNVKGKTDAVQKARSLKII